MKAFVLAVGLLAVNGVAAVAASPGANPFDGTWAEVIVGENKVCDVVVNTSFTVTNGHLSQNNSSGEVSRERFGERHRLRQRRQRHLDWKVFRQ